jgi:hypothetical protein
LGQVATQVLLFKKVFWQDKQKVDEVEQVKQETSQFRHYEFDKYFAEVH